MASLADQLLADFDDGDEDEAGSDVATGNQTSGVATAATGVLAPAALPAAASARVSCVAAGGATGADVDVDDNIDNSNDDDDDADDDADEQDDVEMAEAEQLAAADEASRAADDAVVLARARRVQDVSALLRSHEMQHVLAGIDKHVAAPRQTNEIVGPVEEDPEYKLLVRANAAAAQADQEIRLVHRFIADRYAKRFPELEGLVLHPLDYARTVQIIGNDMDIASLNLSDVLPAATLLVVTTAATTTTGSALSDEELGVVGQACDQALQLDAARIRILKYVESRMSFLAPNLSAVVGTRTAALLIGRAGGLTALSKMPACNVLVLGARKKAAGTGFAASAEMSRDSYISTCDVMHGVPQLIHKRACRLIASKCTLAARIDSLHSSPDGHLGRSLREEVDAKLTKWQEPGPGRTVKALPAPKESTKRRRGGRKYRRMKARLGMTEMRKQANRVEFGVAEKTYGEEEIGLGMLGSSGKVRVAAVDTQRLGKAAQRRLDRKLQRKPASSGTKTAGLKSSLAGTATSLAFTPVQGIELENPHARAQAVAKANEKWFGQAAGFTGVRADKERAKD